MTQRLAGLRVGLVGPLPPPSGGMANQTRQLAALLSAAGAEVTLVQTNAPYAPSWVGRLPMVRALARLLRYLPALWRAAGRSQIFHVMANSGWSWHLFAVPAIWMAWLRGVPTVVNYRGGEAGAFLERSHRLVKFSLARTAACLVPSRFLQEVFARHGIGVKIVPNVIDLSTFSVGTTPVSVAAPHLVVARNLEPLYDNATALQAFVIVRERFPQARLTIAGSGPQGAELQALAQRLGVSDAVHFAGRLERAEMVSLLQSASVALNPSLADNMPNSVLEALACGVPVVSTNVGGVPYIVEDGTSALLVPPKSPEAMAHAVLRLLENPRLCSELKGAGLDLVQRYTWHEVAPVLAQAYQAAVQARQASS